MRTVDKVTAFITRWKNDEPELLVLHHPLSGRQLPAGTVEINENLEQAMLREVAEETGLVDIKIVAYLGHIDTTLPADQRIILLTTKLFSSPSFDSSSEGYILERGLPVQVINEIGKFSKILSDPLDPYEQPTVRRKNVTGYVRSSLLGKKIRRHMFHLGVISDTPDSWEKQADGHLFAFCWLKLLPRPILHSDHSQFLDLIYERLLTNG